MSTPSKIYSGTVIKSEVRKFPHPDPYIGRYSPSTEHYFLKALVAFETDEGQDVWFYSPGVTEWISCPVGCPIAIHHADSNDWIDGSEDRPVAEVGKPNSGIKGPKVKVGDRITVKAKVKHENTKFGTQLFYTKLLQLESAELAGV